MTSCYATDDGYQRTGGRGRWHFRFSPSDSRHFTLDIVPNFQCLCSTRIPRFDLHTSATHSCSIAVLSAHWPRTVSTVCSRLSPLSLRLLCQLTRRRPSSGRLGRDFGKDVGQVLRDGCHRSSACGECCPQSIGWTLDRAEWTIRAVLSAFSVPLSPSCHASSASPPGRAPRADAL